MWIVAILIAVGIIAKFIGCGLLSSYFGFNRQERVIIGVGMIPRGEYSIIIAQIAIAASAITLQLYGVIISFMVLSIIVTPIFFRLVRHK